MSARSVLDTRRWSLTARMTLFFGLAISMIVVCVSAMMYAELVHQLLENEEVELLEALQSQQEILQAPPGVGALSRGRAAPVAQDENQQFAWQLFARDGRILARSANAAALAAAFAHGGSDKPFARVRLPGPQERSFLVADIGKLGTDHTLVLRGLLDVSHDEQVLDRYLEKLLIVVILAILASVAIGWLLVRRGLAPLRAISTAMAGMNAERLNTRISQQDWPAELRILAQTFDELMARLEQSFDKLSRFSSDLAHELRSPINNLVAAASVTLSRERSGPQYQETLDVVVEEGARLSRMISKMLFLARVDNARQVVQREALSSAREFATLLDFFSIVAEEQGVTLAASGDVTLHADALLLRQALSNLLSNALRHTARGGNIRLDAQDRGDTIAITVTDDGSGIAESALPFLFDRFYQVDAARSTADSTGLGLAIVRSIVELHGGTVAVSSTLGQGTCFTLLLPKHADFENDKNVI
ncbi:MAG: heavy metal sensor histidine kinase [Massilia sp.]